MRSCPAHAANGPAGGHDGHAAQRGVGVGRRDEKRRSGADRPLAAMVEDELDARVPLRQELLRRPVARVRDRRERRRVVRPAVPGALPDAVDRVGIVEDRPRAADVRAVHADEERPRRIERQCHGIAEAPRDQLRRRSARPQPEDRAGAEPPGDAACRPTSRRADRRRSSPGPPRPRSRSLLSAKVCPVRTTSRQGMSCDPRPLREPLLVDGIVRGDDPRVGGASDAEVEGPLAYRTPGS